MTEISNAAAVMGRKGGRGCSPKKLATCRANGKLGGRPRRYSPRPPSRKEVTAIAKRAAALSSATAPAGASVRRRFVCCCRPGVTPVPAPDCPIHGN